jgi:hypothetical protein
MKIDTDLRQAVRSACNAQPREDWTHRGAKTKLAIEQCLILPKHYKRAVQMMKLQEKAKADLVVAEKFFNALGIAGSLSHIQNETTFKRNGGVVPKDVTPWRYDDVMKELAAATPKNRNAILKRYGINWS